LDQIFGQVYRIRTGPDCSMKILDWIRIAKISNLFNTAILPDIQRANRIVIIFVDQPFNAAFPPF